MKKLSSIFGSDGLRNGLRKQLLRHIGAPRIFWQRLNRDIIETGIQIPIYTISNDVGVPSPSHSLYRRERPYSFGTWICKHENANVVDPNKNVGQVGEYSISV